MECASPPNSSFREIGPVPVLSNDGTIRNHYSSELIIRLILRTGIRRKAAYTVTAIHWSHSGRELDRARRIWVSNLDSKGATTSMSNAVLTQKDPPFAVVCCPVPVFGREYA